MEELMKNASLAGLLTGTITGFCKYSSLSEKEKKNLASQLLWCYETSGCTISPSLKEEIEKILAS